MYGGVRGRKTKVGRKLHRFPPTRFFFQMLPTDFTKQDAVKAAEVLGVTVRTVERWLVKFVQSSEILRVAHGGYQKVS